MVRENLLRNYRQLVTKADELCRRIIESYGPHIVCSAGCDACCRHLSLFPVEGAALAIALENLPGSEASYIRRRVTDCADDQICPLLQDGLCLLYTARPIICRTHGLPVISREGDCAVVDFCPRNFRGVDSLPGQAIIDLDLLNSSLSAVNELFLAENTCPPIAGKERITIAAALLLAL